MMKAIILLFFLEYVLCRNLESDFSVKYTNDLKIINKYVENLKTSYSLLDPKIIGIDKDDVTLLVYTKADIQGAEITLADANTITSVSSFNTKLKTVFYIHGWLDTVNAEGSTMIKEALLKATDVNVIIVNWDKCASSIDYFVSQRCVADVGKYVGEFIETVSRIHSYSLSDVTAVGHSLGAHIGGHIGKYTNGTLGIIIGLDPAGPFYFKGLRDARLNEDDAQYVQGIHTDAQFLGVNFDVGHADFWPNGGFSQKGCGIDVQCSHIHAYKYYAESVTNNTFFARKCDSYELFGKSDCKQNYKSLMGGVNVDLSATGNFYLDTNSDSPWGMGDVV